MEEIKTLANCGDIEFLQQTNKIRHAVEEWITVTDIDKIKKRMAKLEPIPEGMDKKQAELIEKKNEEKRRKQVKENFNAILDACLEDHPEETAKVIRMCCFVEPNDNSRPMIYYINAFTQMIGNQDVLEFFSSLVRLGQTFGLTL